MKTQREKDVGAYSVKAALSRSNFFKNASPHWKALLALHFSAVCWAEFHSASAFGRMTRFGRSPGLRNMATFGTLDEIRHGQIQIYFAYEFLRHDRVFDWCHKSSKTENWIIISLRHALDDIAHTRDAISAGIMLNMGLEQAFTNLQFVALSADAARFGDHTFATMLQSIQSDEARHAQIGEPLVRIMLENGRKKEAQQMVDVAFWRMWKQFSALSGIGMDYYTPLEHRENSLKEFMDEWVLGQFARSLEALGLDRPWYWDYLAYDIATFHHAQQIGVYIYRATEWWRPIAGVSPEERDWLEEKYPGWNDTYGKCWDVIVDNIRKGRYERTTPVAPPLICNMCGLEVSGVAGGQDARPRLPHPPRRAALSLLLAGLQMGLRAGAGALQGPRQYHRPRLRRHDPARRGRLLRIYGPEPRGARGRRLRLCLDRRLRPAGPGCRITAGATTMA